MVDAFVYIIESLSVDDLADDRNEGDPLGKALTLDGIEHVYHHVETFDELLDALTRRLLEAEAAYEKVPILHLSMHGDPEGIRLTDRTNCSWEHFRRLLTPTINRLQGHLLICMSSCFGATGSRMAMNGDEGFTIGYIVGNWGAPTWSNAATAYASFYRHLFQKKPIGWCVKEMQLSSGDPNFGIIYGPSARAGWAEIMTQLLGGSAG